MDAVRDSNELYQANIYVDRIKHFLANLINYNHVEPWQGYRVWLKKGIVYPLFELYCLEKKCILKQ